MMQDLVDLFLHEANEYYNFLISLYVICFIKDNFLLVALVAYLLWYLKAYYSSKIDIITKNDSKMQKLLTNFPSIISGYKPSVWCFHGHINTVLYIKVQLNSVLDYKREDLVMPDDGLIVLDWINLETTSKLVVLVLPGLTGCSKDNYVAHMVEKAHKLQCKAVVMNYRGIESQLKTPKTFCATSYDDLHIVIQHIQNRYKDHKIFAVGLSLGGLKLAGYLCENKYNNPSLLSHAMVISTPYNMSDANDELEKIHNYLMFNYYLTRRVNQYFSSFRHLFESEDKYDCGASFSRWSSLREFEAKFIAVQFNYKSIIEYYEDARLDSKLRNIKVPTIFLNSDDDPFSPNRSFPIDDLQSNDNIAMVKANYGGHIAFCEGLIPLNCNFSCRLLTDYLKHILNEIQATDGVNETTEINCCSCCGNDVDMKSKSNGHVNDILINESNGHLDVKQSI